MQICLGQDFARVDLFIVSLRQTWNVTLVFYILQKEHLYFYNKK